MLVSLLALVVAVNAAPVDPLAIKSRADHWLTGLAAYGLPATDANNFFAPDLAVRTHAVSSEVFSNLPLIALDFGIDEFPMSELVVFGQSSLPTERAEVRRAIKVFDRAAAAMSTRLPPPRPMSVSRAAAELLAALPRRADTNERPFRPALYLAQAAEIITPLLAEEMRLPGSRWLILDAAITLRRRIVEIYPGGPGGDHSLERVNLNRRLIELSAAIEAALLAIAAPNVTPGCAWALGR